MIYIIGFIALWLIGSAIFWYFAAKNAPIIDDTQPFLHDDYGPNKDETKKS
jgi:hypothetical protein